VVDSYVEGDLTGASEDVRAVLVTVGGRPLLEQYYDSSAEATGGVFSVTKSVMSILVGIALDGGDLGSVEQTLAELLPDYAATMAPEVAAITLRQVLTMTGCQETPRDQIPCPSKPLTIGSPPSCSASSYGHLGEASRTPVPARICCPRSWSRRPVAPCWTTRGRSSFDPLGISTESAAEPLPSSKTCRSTRRHPSHGPSTRKGATPRSLTVADEYFAVTDKVEARYGKAQWLSADAIGPKMARLRREHHRLLGNGYCTRPPELDCAFESICENCSFFQTSIEFRPTLQAQHDHAASHGQQQRGRHVPATAQ